jgi:2-oxoglutarate dehydrogenase E1 component
MEEFLRGGFKEIIDDNFTDDPSQVKKVLFCSGKIFFELLERQQKENKKDTAIVRLEQIYPLPFKQLEALYKKYSNATWFWCRKSL